MPQAFLLFSLLGCELVSWFRKGIELPIATMSLIFLQPFITIINSSTWILEAFDVVSENDPEELIILLPVQACGLRLRLP
jgi:hypothetical protein